MSLLPPPEKEAWTPGKSLLYLLACAGLVCAFNGRYLFSPRVGILDWPKELFYFHYLGASLREYGELPVSFFTVPESLRHFSTLQDLSYWSNPEVVTLSPFLPLLFFFSTAVFLKLYMAGHFLLGIAGTGLLARRLGFGPLEGVLLFALAMLNPWITQHLAIGYSPAVNALLLPGFAALLLAPPRSPLQQAAAAAVNALIFYQGALHLFIWINLAALLAAALGCGRTGSIRPLARVLWVQALTFTLIFPKYLAVTKAYHDFVRIPGGGYASMAALWGLLTDSTSPLFDFPATYTRYGVAFYDASLCVGGWFVALALAAPAALAAVPPPGSRRGPFPAFILAACALIFLTLGWGDVWERFTRLVPVLRSEIYPFRWLYVAYLFAVPLALAGAVRASSLLLRPWMRSVALLALLLPVLAGYHQRNALFAEVMVQEEDIFAGFTLQEYLKHRVTGLTGDTLLPGKASPSALELIPPGEAGDPVHLPWLQPWRLREYEFVNARPDIFQPGNSTTLLTTMPERPVRIEAKTYSRGVLGGLCLGLFALLTLVSRAVNGQRPRREDRLARPGRADEKKPPASRRGARNARARPPT
jgi:hypothetical protein